MTNKTITLAPDLACPFCGSKELKQVTDDGVHFTQCKSCEATGPTGFKRGEDDAVCWNTRAALADPVPPAGGDVKVLGYSVKGNRYAIRLTKGELLELSENYTGTVLIELVDRAHVTRLQAEVKRLDLEVSAYDYAHDALSRERDALKAELRKTNLTNQDFVSQIRDLQAELTKARELIGDLRADTQSGYLKAVQALHNWANQPAPRGYSNIVMTGTSCNQSAPADKDEECVHDFRMFSGECHKCGADWIPGKDYAPADKGQCESVACTHGIRAPHACDQCEAQNAVPDYWEDPDTGTCIDQWSKIQGLNGTEAYSIPLYRHAEQPAPVAVVMPERKTVKAGLLSESNTHNQGWNACLDELARLNPIKQ